MTKAGGQKLKREMSGFGGMVITLTNLSPSIGVFVAVPVVIQQSGSFAIVACALAVLLGLVVAGVYAELGSAIPHAGGDYVLIGLTLGPTARFANLSTGLVGLPVALALSGLGISDFLKVVWPGVPVVPTALVCIVIVTVLGALSVRLNAWITGAFLVLEILAMIATAALGAGHWRRDLADVVLHPVMAGPAGALQATPLLAMGVAGAAALYALNGYGGAVSFGEEVVGARSKMIWMIYGALVLGAATIIPPVIGVIVGARDLARLSASATPLQDFLLEAGGPWVAGVISVSVALAIFNAMIAIALIGGRVLYSAARENAWTPRLNRTFRRVHARFGSPWAATLAIGAGGLLLCLLPLPVLVMINGSFVSISYGLLAAGVIAGRRSGVTSRSQARMPLHPIGPAIVILVAAGLVAAGLADRGAGRIGLLIALGVMAAGALYYQLVLRRSGLWAHHDPEEEEDAAPTPAVELIPEPGLP
ncbi:MAG: APC family permease [Caulobacteraceae bacterium]|nr:APC family permease [Caulobacteraceae bacterium]